MRKSGSRNYIYIYIYILVGILLIGVCGYGHAALNTELQISGEATVKPTAKTFGIQYMQDMTSAICARAVEGTSERLTDKRDGKMYWVAKMKDGHCWMTQNLALDLTTEGLTSELTDLQPNNVANYETTINEKGETILHWNAKSKYVPQNTVVGPFTASDTAANRVSAKSSRPGRDYIMGRPYSYTANNAKVSSFADVTGVDVKDVTGWQPTYEYKYQGSDLSDPVYSYDAQNKTYDAHYLFGNLYQFGAATAGSALQATTQTTRSKAASSICPRNWRLPDQTSLTNNEYQNLLKAYNVTKVFSRPEPGPLNPPLYLIFAGYVTSGAKYYRIGQYGTYATNRGGDTAGDWYIFMIDERGTYGTITGSHGGATAFSGRSIRCVAR